MALRFARCGILLGALVSSFGGCAEDIVVGPGDSCTHEGWFGPDRVCPSGYVCDDTKSWTCQRYAPSSSGSPPASSVVDASVGRREDASSTDASSSSDASDERPDTSDADGGAGEVPDAE